MDTSPKSWLEARRLRAWELKNEGWSQRQIARAFGVSEGAVSQWIKAGRDGGPDRLKSRPHPGPLPRLAEEQLARLPQLLERGAESFGFRGQVWTRARVGALILKEFGVSDRAQHAGRVPKRLG